MNNYPQRRFDEGKLIEIISDYDKTDELDEESYLFGTLEDFIDSAILKAQLEVLEKVNSIWHGEAGGLYIVIADTEKVTTMGELVEPKIERIRNDLIMGRGNESV